MFGIFGHGNVAGIGEALGQFQEQMPYYRGQNEQSMAHAAIAYAKANRARRVMGVTTSIGPGATNLVTAAALAHINRLPVLFLPGDIYASRRPDPVLQQLESEKSPLASVNDCFIPVSRFFDRITRPEQLIESLPQAVRTLLDPQQRGPVTLALPQDAQAEKYLFPAHFFEEKLHAIYRTRPDLNQLHRCAEMIKGAKRPLMIVGGGIHYSGAEETLRQFVEKHQIPICETQAGKCALPWDHPMNLGGIGVTGTSAANRIAQEADLVLCVGTRLSDFTTASKSLFHRPEVQFIGLNVSSFDALKGNGEMLICDAQAGLEELSSALGETVYQQQIQQVKEDWELQYREATEPKGEGLPSDAEVLYAVNQMVGPKDIVLCAAGGLPGELHKLWRSSDPLSYHLEYGYSCMGYEIAGGLGAKMAHPDREVYVLVGDGSYLMMHTELLTANQLGYKINVVLLDNRGFGCINRLQKSCGSAPFGNLFQNDVKVDFAKNAESYGCHSAHVQTLEELQNTLRKNLKESRSCVTVIDTNPQKSSSGYAWWDVAVAEHSEQKGVQEARQKYEEMICKLK